VWDDGVGGDSLFDALVDAAVAGVEVRLIDGDGDLVATTVTIEDGTYAFTVDKVGTYRVEFVAPPGSEFVSPNVGTDDSVDSDVESFDVVTGVGSSVALAYELGGVGSVDAGLILDPALSTP
jgi:hypothetical protein